MMIFDGFVSCLLRLTVVLKYPMSLKRVVSVVFAGNISVPLGKQRAILPKRVGVDFVVIFFLRYCAAFTAMSGFAQSCVCLLCMSHCVISFI